jgi:hypothetical protein
MSDLETLLAVLRAGDGGEARPRSRARAAPARAAPPPPPPAASAPAPARSLRSTWAALSSSFKGLGGKGGARRAGGG